MNDVTLRFIEVYEYLKNRQIVSGQSDFAQKIGVSPSTITDIRKERTNPGVNVIRGIVSNFNEINPYWILTGEGEMIQKEYNTPTTKEVNEVVNEPKRTYTTRIRTINLSPKPKQKLSPTLSPTGKKDSKSALPKVVTVDHAGNDNIIMVPVAARAGYLLGYGDPEYIAELPAYHIPRLNNGTFRAFEVDGHSMVPTVNHGDIVFAEWCERFEDITDDRVYVIVTKTDGIVIKRVLNRILKYGFIVAKSDSVTNRRQYPNLNIPPEEILELWAAKMYLGADFSSPHSIWDRLSDLEADIEYLKRRKES